MKTVLTFKSRSGYVRIPVEEVETIVFDKSESESMEVDTKSGKTLAVVGTMITVESD